jgi:trans-2,3-dihydro-3-hydroxyanthranilate isomerase
MKIEFVTVDVFTTQAFGGNPLAVIPDARGLTGEQMQRIAAEFNLAESTFVLPPENPAHTAQVRIFTPRAELPFAGHPNIGTAFVLARRGESDGRPVRDPLVFEEKAGLVEIDLTREAGTVTGARLAAPLSVTVDEEVPLETVASACAIDPDDIETAHHRPTIASSGVPFVLVELKSRRALSKAVPRNDVFEAHLPADRTTGIHLYVQSPEGRADIQARMFAPLLGVPEDPATGSANVILIGFLAGLDDERDVTLTRTIAQGVDMGRPSLLYAEARKEAGHVTAMWIGGSCVPMMSGTLTLP